jgi:hypothetical protein
MVYHLLHQGTNRWLLQQRGSGQGRMLFISASILYSATKSEHTLIEWRNIVLTCDPWVGKTLNFAGCSVCDGTWEFSSVPE